MVGRQRRVAKRQGITMNANVLRSESKGSIHINSADPGRAARDPLQFPVRPSMTATASLAVHPQGRAS